MSISYRDDIYLALRTIRYAKTRSFLTVLGIVIGIVSVVTIVSVANGIKSQVSGQINASGKDLILVKPGQLNKSNSSNILSNLSQLSNSNSISSLTQNDVASVAKTPGLESSTALNIVNGQVKSDNGKYSVVVIGAGDKFPSLANQKISYGEYLDSSSSDIYQAVIGQNIAYTIFGEKIPLGKSFKFHGETFIVRGVFDQFKSAPLSLNTDFNNAIFIPYQTAQNLTNNTAPIYEIMAKAQNSSSVSSSIKTINQNLLQLHGGIQDFTVLKQSQSLVITSQVLDSITYLISIVASIALVVGGVGIMNVTLVSITERTKEIGIRKAIGATNSQILMQFLIESSVLSLFGGILGVIISFMVDYGLILTTSLSPKISWPILVIAFLLSLSIGIIFGSLPAFKAARKDPILALRYE